MNGMRVRFFPVILCSLFFVIPSVRSQAAFQPYKGITQVTAQPDEAEAAFLSYSSDGQAVSDSDEADLAENAEEYLDLETIEEALSELTATDEFSFLDTVKALLSGEIPLDEVSFADTLSGLLLGELRQQKQLAVRILLVALVSAVFSNFVQVFENRQISEISFYMTYLVLSALLLHSFSRLTNLVSETLNSLEIFMEILLPSYVITIVLSAGSITAIGFYELTVLTLGLLQTVLQKMLLPMVHFYMLVLLLNQVSAEHSFTRFAELLETLISWGVKSVFGAATGLQAVQCLVTPAVDSMKNSALTRIVSVIPGVGQVLNAAAQTVAGSAVVIKNAVGVAGIFALLAICFAPFVRLAVCILLFHLVCAAIQPVCEKRMVEGIESISRGTVLLLHIMSCALAIFVISLAMITASVKNG